MRRLGWVVALASVVAGCVSTDDQRLHDYNDDGIALFRRGAYSQARETFQAALTLKPADPNLLYNLGQCYDHLDQTDKAEETYRSCLRQAPDHADALHGLTALLVRQQKRDQAGRAGRGLDSPPTELGRRLRRIRLALRPGQGLSTGLVGLPARLRTRSARRSCAQPARPNVRSHEPQGPGAGHVRAFPGLSAESARSRQPRQPSEGGRRP